MEKKKLHGAVFVSPWQEQEEEPMGFGEAQLLQESMQPQPEEFVAIADYAATDETQVAVQRM